MQPTQKLTSILRRLLELVEAEAGRNPSFAAQLEELTAPLPTKKPPQKEKERKSKIEIPDVLAALQEKGIHEFAFWLRSFDLPTLKAIVKANGFDVAKVSQRWTEPDKFVTLISEQAAAQLRRGSAFLRKPDEPERL